MFLETSALTGENVEETFLKCARTILAKVESGSHSIFDILCFYLNSETFINGVISKIFFTGDLDPEKMGSGIQYGDATLRRLNRQQQPKQRKGPCDC